MVDQTTKKPLIRAAWLRVALFGACFALITLLIAIPAVLTLTDVKVADLKADLIHTLANQLTGPYLWLMLVLEFVISFVSVWLFRVWVDRRSFSSLGWEIDGYQAEVVTGFFMGPVLLGITALLLLLSGHLVWADIVWDPSALGISLGFMVLIAFSEETVFRGYILCNLLESFDKGPAGKGSSGNKGSSDSEGSLGSKWIPLAISSILFAAFHLTSPGMNTLAFTNLFLAGILLGLNYTYTRNLWFSIGFHFSWNFFEGPLLGFRVSGLNMPSLLQVGTKGDQLLTGGEFGLESSVICTALLLIGIFILVWAFERKYNTLPADEPAPEAGTSKESTRGDRGATA